MTYSVDIGGVVARITENGVLTNPDYYQFGLMEKWLPDNNKLKMSIGYDKFELNSTQKQLLLNLEIVEIITIAMALHRTGYNRTKAAKVLGISRKGLYRKLKKYQMKEL